MSAMSALHHRFVVVKMTCFRIGRIKIEALYTVNNVIAKIIRVSQYTVTMMVCMWGLKQGEGGLVLMVGPIHMQLFSEA